MLYSSPTASPDFEGRGGDELAEKICRILSIAYDKSGTIDLKKLSITPKKYCYVIDVDILVRLYWKINEFRWDKFCILL